ncbi:unnamed protein product [Rotaria sordida]|uniref:TIR domain-containing protein n=1 Tax=Rotaria sordida TaxID=392033 RepID=A0A815H391_9BILA|nr:unnamed protein product [Rotaria sordida]
MVSYSHKDSSFCQKLVKILKDRVQGDVWVDFIKLQPPYEDDWEEIAEAITDCDVVVMIVTANYCSSKSCRREVIHADKRSKRMIPVYHGSEYEPEDWFEIRAGSATWVRFGCMKSDEDVMETLIKLINCQETRKNRVDTVTIPKKLHPESNDNVSSVLISSSIVDASPSQSWHPIPLLTDPVGSILTISSPVPTSRKPVEQWIGDEVQEWLHLPSSILQLSNGRALLTYARLISDEDIQRDEYERNLRDRGLTREQWANLISSLTTLCMFDNKKMLSNTLPEQWSSDDVKYWLEQHKLPKYLLDTFSFVDGIELVIYAKMMIASPTRVDSEYDRLRARVRVRNNGQDLLQLDDYARFVRALKKLVEQS